MLKVLPCWVGEWVTDNPVKHCAVLMKMVIIIKVIGRCKRESLSKRVGTICLSKAKLAFQMHPP